MPPLSDLLPMPRLRITRGLLPLQIAEETHDDNADEDDDGDTDQMQGVRTHNGSVQVSVCLLSCAEVFK